MERRRFRIGELAEHLAVEQMVIRLWEKEFGIRSRRTESGQRFYTERELRKFAEIKELLHSKGFSIDSAKKMLAGEQAEVSLEAEAEMVHEALAPAPVHEEFIEPIAVEESIIASKITNIEQESFSYSDALRSIRAQLALLSDLLGSC